MIDNTIINKPAISVRFENPFAGIARQMESISQQMMAIIENANAISKRFKDLATISANIQKSIRQMMQSLLFSIQSSFAAFDQTWVYGRPNFELNRHQEFKSIIDDIFDSSTTESQEYHADADNIGNSPNRPIERGHRIIPSYTDLIMLVLCMYQMFINGIDATLILMIMLASLIFFINERRRP